MVKTQQNKRIMEVVKFKMNFDDIRDLIKKHNSSEHGKDSYPVELFPNDINDIAREILRMHREALSQANAVSFLDLDDLKKKLDEALAKETTESLNKFLKNKKR